MDRLASLSLSGTGNQSTQLNFSTQKVVSVLRECSHLVQDSKNTRTGWRKDKFALPTDALERTLNRSADSINRLYQEFFGDFGAAVHTFDVTAERQFSALNDRCIELRTELRHSIDSKHRIKNAELLQESASEIGTQATDALQSMRFRLLRVQQQRMDSTGTRPVDIPPPAITTASAVAEAPVNVAPISTFDSRSFGPDEFGFVSPDTPPAYQEYSLTTRTATNLSTSTAPSFSRSFSDTPSMVASPREMHSHFTTSTPNEPAPVRRAVPSSFDHHRLDNRPTSRFSTSNPASITGELPNERHDSFGSASTTSSQRVLAVSPPAHQSIFFSNRNRTSTAGSVNQNLQPTTTQRSRETSFAAGAVSYTPGPEVKGTPSKSNDWWGFCQGAWNTQKDRTSSLSVIRRSHGPVQSFRMFLECKAKGCNFQGRHCGKQHKTPDIDNKVHTHAATQISFRWIFLMKSHKTCAARDTGAGIDFFAQTYGCLFCCEERVRSPNFGNADSLFNHIWREHSDSLTEKMVVQNAVIKGRYARPEEDWDINIPQGFQETKLEQSALAETGGTRYFEMDDGQRSPVGPSELAG